MTYLKDIYKKYSIGDYSYGNPIIIDRWGGGLQIGRFCSIADGVKIMLGGNHRTDWITTYPFTVIYKEFNGISGHPKREKEIIIGNDVWIGQDAFILPGANIGDGAVIGARALVSKSVEPYSIFVGNPGETIRKRFDEKTIERLLEIKWWDWDIEKIKKNVNLLCSNNVENFINEIPK